ncbi:MAG: hypothetical protein OXF06_02080 [Bacteroidetes bacterium]|nr:hypothetical protein [Bacteroidota bacterium]
MTKSYPIIILMVFLIGTLGCSGPTVSPLISTATDDSLTTAPNDWSTNEEFDIAPYLDPLQNASEERFHDVPDILVMTDAEVDIPAEEEQGFRIQILATLDKLGADVAFEEALVWWESFDADSSLRDIYTQIEPKPPVYLDFRPPYYRLRIGNFLNRSDAEDLLGIIQRNYEGAFIAPGTILIR